METARETKLPWWGWMGVLCILPVAYVLSIFPVAVVGNRLREEPPDLFLAFYGPVIWAMDQWDWFRRSMEWIAEGIGLI